MNIFLIRRAVFLVFAFSLVYEMAAAQQKALRIIILRHAEKPPQGDNLSCMGLNRAFKLPAVIVRKFGVPGIAYVPAPSVGKATKSGRMMQTVWPLAVKYNLTVNTKFEVEQTKKLADDLLKRTGTVIVVWEHDNIPKIITALGVDSKKVKWKGDDFDSLWIVNISGGARTLQRDEQGIRPAQDCSF